MLTGNTYLPLGAMQSSRIYTLLLLVHIIAVTTLAQTENTREPKFIPRIQRNIKKENATRLLFRDLLENYDRRIRPYFGTGQPAVVTVDFYLASFDSIRESHMDFGITIYLRQKWHDPRLEHDSEIILPTTSHYVDDLWVPDLIVTNAKEAHQPDVTIPNRWVNISPSGHVLYNMRLNLQLSCEMDFHRFPVDSQSCEVDFESFEYILEEVQYLWNEEEPVEFHVELLKLPQYEIDGVHVHNCTKELRTGMYSCIGADFLFHRTLGYYLLQTYIPSTLLVVTSWVSFWIQIKGSPARVALGVTTILTMITTNNGVRADLPKVSYIKAIDVWFAACFFFVIGALVEYALAHYLSYNKANLKVLCPCGSSDEKGSVTSSHCSTDGIKTDSRTCMVLTIEDSPDEAESEISDRVYHRNERRTPEADQNSAMGSYTNFAAEHTRLPTISRKTNNGGKKLRIQGKCRPKAKGGGNLAYNAGKRIDRICRIAFPLGWVLFNVGYWSYYIKQAENPTHSFGF